jgi:hypothetical protein
MNNAKEASVYRVFDNLKGKIPEHISFEINQEFCSSLYEKIGKILLKVYGNIYIHSYHDFLNKEEFDLLFNFFDKYISENRNITAIIYEEDNKKIPIQTKDNTIHTEGLERLIKYINEQDKFGRYDKYFKLYIDCEIPFDRQFWESLKSYMTSMEGKIKKSITEKITERIFTKIRFPKTNYIYVYFELKVTINEIF